WWLQWPAALAIIIVPAIGFYYAAGRGGQLARYQGWIALGWVVLAALLVVPQKIIHEEHNPVSRLLQKGFHPVFNAAMAGRWLVIPLAVVLCVSIYWPLVRLGTQFTPPLYEGDLEYMPTTYPGLSVGEAKYVLQQSDKIIKHFPEVKSVWGRLAEPIPPPT
ncbi:cation efflux system protein CusA, partial [mine drainage metagenome]